MADEPKRKLKIDDLPEEQKELSPDEAKNVKGGLGTVFLLDTAQQNTEAGWVSHIDGSHKAKTAEIQDGTSNTMMVGETLPNQS